MRTRFIVGTIILTLGALATGCGSSSKTPAKHRTDAVTPSRTGAAKLPGAYVRTLTKADFARTQHFRHEGPGQSLPPTGVYHLTFTANTFRATDPTGFAVAQTYSARDSGQLNVILYVSPDQGAFCGPDIPQYASYGWQVSGGALMLTAKHDSCADRDSILQGKWTRVG
jgi:hypothetical protein